MMASTNEDKAWLAERFDATDRRLDGIDKDLDHLEEHFLQFRTEVIRRLDSIDQRLEIVDASVTSINVHPFTKGLLDLGSLVG